MEPFLESMSYDVPGLQKKWKSIAENWFSMNHKEVCLELLLTNGYELLDLHPNLPYTRRCGRLLLYQRWQGNQGDTV